jgi:hypothetical protein
MDRHSRSVAGCVRRGRGGGRPATTRHHDDATLALAPPDALAPVSSQSLHDDRPEGVADVLGWHPAGAGSALRIDVEALLAE